MITITLSREDRELVLEHVCALDDVLRARIQFATAKKGHYEHQCSLDTFTRFITAIEVACGEEDDPDVRHALMMLHNRLKGILPGTVQRMEENKPQNLAAEINEQIRRLLKERGIHDIDEANALIQKFTDEHNRRPVPEFGGYSPEQVYHLMRADWEHPDSVFSLNKNIPPYELTGAALLADARLLLRLLQEQGGAKTTGTGNLNRKFVAQYVEQMTEREEILQYQYLCKRGWNEDEIGPLNTLRHVIQIAGLIRKNKGYFKITKEAGRLLQENNAGELYARLFFTFFRRFNLACLDFMGECPGVQETVAFSFLMLRKHAHDWTSFEALLPRLFLPAVIQEIPVFAYDGKSQINRITEWRILEPLRKFGLLEFQYEKINDPYPISRLHKLRVTPLFDTFFRFRLE